MKLNAREAERFCSRPDPACPAVLIQGPDEGAVRERAQAVIKAVLGSPPDRDRLTGLSAADLKADPACLRDELTTLSMFPGARIVHVRESAEPVPRAVASVLSELAAGTLTPEALLLVEAGDLPKRSALRQAFENHKRAVVIACYADSGSDLQRLLRDGLAEFGLKARPEALEILSAVLGEDRGVTRQELLKLALYKGAAGRAPEDPEVTAGDVEACLIAPGEAAASAIIDAVGSGEVASVDALVSRAFSAGTSGVGLLRQSIMHFQKLHALSADPAISQNPAVHYNRISGPRLHYSREGALRQHLRLWSGAGLERALLALADAERQCKTTGMPDRAICHRTLLRLANHAARAAAAA